MLHDQKIHRKTSVLDLIPSDLVYKNVDVRSIETVFQQKPGAIKSAPFDLKLCIFVSSGELSLTNVQVTLKKQYNTFFIYIYYRRCIKTKLVDLSFKSLFTTFRANVTFRQHCRRFDML